MTPTLDFWFSIGSTYTYLSVMRIEAMAAEQGITVRWCPFSVRTLMLEQDNIPFRDKPVKAAYMWRDIERRAAARGNPICLPVPYPLSQWDRVNRIAVLSAHEGWCGPYVVETYRRWFQHGEEPGLEPQLFDVLRAVGREPVAVLERAATAEVEAAYLAATEAARQHGLFGAPSFVVDSEIFWGDDRLEDALAWAKRVS
jgi:2-hydroxychromene-2-carboxylate isomerase